MSKSTAVLIAFVLGTALAYWLPSDYRIDNFNIVQLKQAELPDGATYTGTFNEQGLMQGQGKLVWSNGAYYEGEFGNGLFNGHGLFVEPSGYRYEGAFLDGLKHGRGKTTYSDGAYFEGLYVHDLKNGSGRFVFSNGRVYEGDFQEDKMTGYGMWTLEGEYHYQGAVKNGYYHGQGTITYDNGNKYVGEFVQGEFHGRGVFSTRDSKIYSGEFVNGSMTGFGSIVDTRRHTHYAGDVENWRPSGTGTTTNRSGEYMTGEYRFGELTGTGVQVDRKGNKYEGNFFNGMKHGEGQMTYVKALDGITTFSGTWNYNNLESTDGGAVIYPPGEIVEHALYHQAQALQTVLDKVPDGDAETIEMYSLGIASYGSEEVFNREIKFIEPFLEQRFALDGRSIYLSNSRRDITTRPLATETSVEQSLQTIGERMNPEQDILFFYITTHGNENKTLSFDHEGLSLHDLSAERLREMLDDSGIKWKVIVISACYSGGFIEALTDEHTLIMTAAAADKTSFGCDDDNDFTWFGKAFFKQALPTTESLVTAFEQARDAVTVWEKEQGVTESVPQIQRSETLEQQLALWQQTLPPLIPPAASETGGEEEIESEADNKTEQAADQTEPQQLDQEQ